MSITLTTMTQDHIDYVAAAGIAIADTMRTMGSDPYIDGFPDAVTPELRQWVEQFVDNDDATGVIALDGNTPVGCMIGRKAESNLPAAIKHPIGEIPWCWIEAKHQRKGIGAQLMKAMEDWFTSKKIDHIELAYMTQNQAAAEAWKSMGFKPFRTFAYKTL